MIAFYMSPLYIAVHLLLFFWFLRWLMACHEVWERYKVLQIIVGILYWIISTSMLTGFLLPRGTIIERFFKSLGNYWLGICCYLMICFFLALFLRLVLLRIPSLKEKFCNRKALAINGIVIATIVSVVSIYGVICANTIRTTSYEVKVEKTTENLDELNVVLVADLHLGYNIGCAQMRQMVKKINAEQPDLVVIAGDIYDNEYEALDNPEKLKQILSGIESKYGVYAVYGNHDIEEKIFCGFTFPNKQKHKESAIEMDELIKDAGITLLRDEAVLIADSFYLYGRPDAERVGRGIVERKTPEEITADLDLSKPVIVLDHEPRQLHELSAAGVDVDLCGHTHDGQIFPANIITAMMWENSYGYEQIDHMHNIVTSGVGVFGPNMRVATKSEIVTVHIEFTEAE